MPRSRWEMILSPVRASANGSVWHRQEPHHPGDRLSCPPDPFVTVHQAAKHSHLPGQGGRKSKIFSIQHSHDGIDGSGQQHLHVSTVDLKSPVSHGL